MHSKFQKTLPPETCISTRMFQRQEARFTSNAGNDAVFVCSVARLYDEYLVPLIFEPYASDLANRLRQRKCSRVLEIAAGTGVVTRALARTLPDDVSIVATDLNEAMLQQAAAIGTKRPVTWECADAMQLPFADESFDTITCQFGAMFFPDKAGAFAQVHRVLRPGGVFLFNVWDRIEENEFADVVTVALARAYRDDPPQFLARTPHGYFERDRVQEHLTQAGFGLEASFETMAARSRAASCCIPAIAYCQGTPLRNEIEARNQLSLQQATAVAAYALESRFGEGSVDGKIQAHIVSVQK